MVEKINQEYANWLLYKAWFAMHMSDQLFDPENDDDKGWYGYWEQARAFYEAWSHYTGIEFEYGIMELRKFSREDFKEQLMNDCYNLA